MWWKSSCYILLAFLLASVFAQECREERSIKEKALRGFIFKKLLVTSFDQCNINCEKEVTCQSFNFVTGEHSCVLKNCELNNRTKEARPENFCSDPDRLYIRRLNGRASLGSTTELPAESCREIKASEGKDAISGKYWLDPTRSGKAVLVHCNMEATNCADIYEDGKRRDGVYTIIPDDLLAFRVFCDQTTAGGGWTVFQKRVNGSVDFYRNWTDYKHGFGDLNSEFWLGLDKVYRLTSDKNNTLRVDLEDFEGNTRYAEYEMFGVMDENDKYKLILGSYSGETVIFPSSFPSPLPLC
ncbi:ficolin-2-like [Stylophora pistillata]|uniref:Ryncolin-2 n=1 Tax=Stylophora pistillata TaxID=50429 RepID=A0A2B4SXX8_STYPI|nr:ficolin-2-like [Stylophora pistillata]PFX33277.1 Ryncolin-2 [Stylophora pistillata]